nr:MAG TPA: hypothetical protein [Bacteriophage sp.]
MKSILKNIVIFSNDLKRKITMKHEYYFDDGYKLYLTRADELLLVDNEGNEVPIHGVKFTVDEKTLECIKAGNDNCYHIEIFKSIVDFKGVKGALLWMDDVRNPTKVVEGLGKLNLMPITKAENEIFSIRSREILSQFEQAFRNADKWNK